MRRTRWVDRWCRPGMSAIVAVVAGALYLPPPVEADTTATIAPPPMPSAERAQRALTWARNQMAIDPNSNVECIVFVERAYNTMWPGNAIDVYNRWRAEGRIHDTAEDIPAGALVFSSNPGFDHGVGHVMLSEGNGTFLTANFFPSPKIREIPLLNESNGNRFLGWAYAP